MNYFIKHSKEELSERMLEAYLKYAEIINWGRKCPVRYCERFYGIELLDHQRYVFMNSWIAARNVWCQSRGSGKALALNTIIPTPTGFSTMGELKVGDYVLDETGNPTKINFVSDIFLGNKCYEIEFEDGERIIADANHLWYVQTRSSANALNREIKRIDKNSFIYNSIDDSGYLILKTSDMLNNFKINRKDSYNEYRYRVLVSKPVQYEEKQLPLHPYILGVWLGDGGSNDTKITCSDIDIKEMCNHINNCGISTKIYDNSKINRTNSIGLGVIKKGSNNIVRDKLRELNVFKNKHIPDLYLYSSIEQRYDLLKGLMDTDGCCYKNGNCEFSQKNYNIIKQVSQLLSSLLIKHHISKRNTICNGNIFESYRIYFKVSKENSCFKLKRKYDRLPEKLLNKFDRKSIISIKEVDSVATKCIQVENPKGLYLCGEKFTVTHNTTLVAPFVMAKSNLFPKHQTYIMAGVGSQSQECFLKIEKIAKNEIASFTGLTDFFIGEIEANIATSDGFIHNPASFTYKLFNDSRVNSLNGNFDNNRSKRSNLNIYDESGFAPEDLFVTSMPYITQDSNFGIGGNQDITLNPKNIPNQAIFASSASDMSTYFYQKAYKEYAKKMFLGDTDYFVADVNANVVFNAKYNGKIYPVSLLTKKEVEDEMRKNKEKALREYFNKFSIDGGDKMPFKRAIIKKNSRVRVPELKNINNKKYIIAYDPARQIDNSVALIAELYNDDKIGYKLNLCAAVSFVDIATKKKIPMRYPEQIQYLKQMIVDYNGIGKQDYENIEVVMIDSGAGGGGRFIADDLMNEWKDKNRNSHKGLIDKIEHEEYLSTFPNNIDKLKLMSPKKYKSEMFDALVEMLNLDLISFTEEYDNKGYIMLSVDNDLEEAYEYEDENGDIIKINKNRETYPYKLSFEEELSLINIDLAKEEIANFYRYDGKNGSCSYDLCEDQKNKMNDDRAYCLAMLGWYLQQKRRGQTLNKPKQEKEIKFKFRQPQTYGKNKSKLFS